MAALSPSEARPEVLAPVSPSEARSEGLAPVSSPEAGPEGLNTAVLASANLVGAAEAWVSSPEWMDFLWDESPARRVKLLERELYLRLWCDLIPPGVRVLDVGGGIGRFAMWCLDRGCDVELVDLDPHSLACARRHAVGRPGRLRTHLAAADALPELEPVDVVIAAELLCYVADPSAVLAAAGAVLRPGGALLCSVEARWGWAMAEDVPVGQISALLENGVVHAPGDRFVQTYTPESFRDLLESGGWAVEQLERSHYVCSGPFERLAGEIDAARLFELEDRFRATAPLAHLNRALLAVARMTGALPKPRIGAASTPKPG